MKLAIVFVFDFDGLMAFWVGWGVEGKGGRGVHGEGRERGYILGIGVF